MDAVKTKKKNRGGKAPMMDLADAIRPFVAGRNSWLFSEAPNGAKAGATFFTLIETAKANGHEPFIYLRHIFEKLPQTETTDDYEALLPWNLDPVTIAATDRQ